MTHHTRVQLLGLGGCRVPVDRCRLVRYDEYMETLDQSFDEKEVGVAWAAVGLS